jgi:hypothetical protein
MKIDCVCHVLSSYKYIFFFFSKVFSTPSLTPHVSESKATQAAQNMENIYPMNNTNDCRSRK